MFSKEFDFPSATGNMKLSPFHRVHCSEKHGLPVPFETFSSWDQSTSDYRMNFTYISDVMDVLGEVLWPQYIVS